MKFAERGLKCIPRDASENLRGEDEGNMRSDTQQKNSQVKQCFKVDRRWSIRSQADHPENWAWAIKEAFKG